MTTQDEKDARVLQASLARHAASDPAMTPSKEEARLRFIAALDYPDDKTLQSACLLGNEAALTFGDIRAILATLPPQHSSGNARELVASFESAVIEYTREGIGQFRVVEARKQLLAALSRQDRVRVCSTCKATVSASPDAMCCHCSEMPWKLAALGSQDRPAPIAADVREALQFYADEWCDPDHEIEPSPALLQDCGEKARQALTSRPAPDGRVLVRREVLEPFLRMAKAFDYWDREVMPDLAYPVEGTLLACACEDCPEAIGELSGSDFARLAKEVAASPSALSGEAGDE